MSAALPLLPKAQWQSDKDVAACRVCKRPFTLMRRRHHCRACGRVFCDACSPHRLRLLDGAARGAAVKVDQRACDSCVVAAMQVVPPPALSSPQPSAASPTKPATAARPSTSPQPGRSPGSSASPTPAQPSPSSSRRFFRPSPRSPGALGPQSPSVDRCVPTDGDFVRLASYLASNGADRIADRPGLPAKELCLLALSMAPADARLLVAIADHAPCASPVGPLPGRALPPSSRAAFATPVQLCNYALADATAAAQYEPWFGRVLQRVTARAGTESPSTHPVAAPSDDDSSRGGTPFRVT